MSVKTAATAGAVIGLALPFTTNPKLFTALMSGGNSMAYAIGYIGGAALTLTLIFVVLNLLWIGIRRVFRLRQRAERPRIWYWIVAALLSPMIGLIGALICLFCSRRRHGLIVLTCAGVSFGIAMFTNLPGQVAPTTTNTIQLGVAQGTYTVQASVNGNPPHTFTLDSGASAVWIPSHVVAQMIDNGQIRANDYVRTTTFIDANGRQVEQPVYNLRTLTVGSLTLRDVLCTAGQDQNTFLLGQTFLAKLPSWSIDNKNGRLIFGS
jgi:hypothetical protein